MEPSLHDLLLLLQPGPSSSSSSSSFSFSPRPSSPRPRNRAANRLDSRPLTKIALARKGRVCNTTETVASIERKFDSSYGFKESIKKGLNLKSEEKSFKNVDRKIIIIIIVIDRSNSVNFESR